MPEVTLVDLPYEILLEIFEEFEQHSLQRLAATCRTLRNVVQPLVMKRQILHLQNLTDRGSLSFGGHTTVRDLFRNGDAVPTSYLRFTLHHGSQLSEDLQALRALLLHLNDIGSVDIFPSLMDNWDFPPPTANTGWMYLLADILNIAASKPEADVTVRRGTGWKSLGRPFKYEHAGAPLKPTLSTKHPAAPTANVISPASPPSHHFFHRLWKIIVGLKIRTRHNDRPHHSTPECADMVATSPLVRKRRHNFHSDIVLPYPASSLLQTFHIHASFLLELPFFDWTLHVLQESPIKRLSFSNVDLTHYDWEYILSSVTIPTLSYISFGSSNIAFPDLQMFISRHPSITTLDLSEGVAIGPLEPFSSQGLLPNLTHLVGNPEYLAHFLEPSFAFPTLQSVTMTSEYGLRSTTYDFRQFEPVLHQIAQRTGEISLALSFLSQAGLNEWLLSLYTRLVAGQLSDVQNVTKVEISVTTLPTQVVANGFVDFIQLFPSLKDLVFTGTFWKGEFDPQRIRDNIWNRYPNLQTMDGEHRP